MSLAIVSVGRCVGTVSNGMCCAAIRHARKLREHTQPAKARTQAHRQYVTHLASLLLVLQQRALELHQHVTQPSSVAPLDGIELGTEAGECLGPSNHRTDNGGQQVLQPLAVEYARTWN